MVLPLLAAGAIGAGAGAVLTALVAGGKKEQGATTTTYGQVYHQPYETYAPQVQYSPQTTYGYQGGTYIINSPEATSKKAQTIEATSSPEQSGAWTIPTTYQPSASTAQGQGLEATDFIPIAIIAAIAIVGYAFFRGK